MYDGPGNPLGWTSVLVLWFLPYDSTSTTVVVTPRSVAHLCTLQYLPGYVRSSPKHGGAVSIYSRQKTEETVDLAPGHAGRSVG
jgi:hypothetical protein